jgi:alpha-tubulin suppressor-like RCC1 family protein
VKRVGVIAPALALGALIFAACGDSDGPSGPQPPASALRFTTVTAGYFHTCGLTTGGRAYCWGWGDEGQLGDGSFRVRDAPVPVSGGRTFVTVSAGHAHSCAVTTDGIAFCWGDDSSGQLGDGGPGAQQKSAVPVAVSGGLRFGVVQAGYYQTCGLTVSGVAYCWGQNDSGQNGDGTTLTRHVPFEVAMEGSMTVVSPGDRFVCGLRGSVTYCWGANRSGELGTGAPSGSAVPVPLAGAPTFASVVTSIGASTVPTAAAYGCGLESDGVGWCWGG